MKKLTKLALISLISFELNAEDILQFKKDKIKELNKNFINSIDFLKGKNKDRIEERESKIAIYHQKAKEIEDKKDASKDDKNALLALQESIQNMIMNQEEEAREEYIVFEEELNTEIKKSISKLAKGVVFEDSNIIYGGKDITKELLDSMDGKEIKKIDTKSNLKICSFNFDRILELKQAQETESYIESEKLELSKLQKELISKKNDQNFNIESSQKVLMKKERDIQTAIQLKQEKLLKNIEDIIHKIASDESIDIVVDSKVVYTSVTDITDKVIKCLNTANSNIKKESDKNSKKVGFISYDTLASNYNKNKNKIDEFNNKNKEIEKILEEKSNKIQSLKDKGGKKEEIDKNIKEFENLRSLKINELMKMRQDILDNVTNDIKNTARIVAKKNGLSVMLVKFKNKPEILYSGKDFTNEVIEILSKN